MGIVGIKATKVFAGPGSFGLIAEAEVDTGAEKLMHVTVQQYGGYECTVSEDSVLDFFTGESQEGPVGLKEEYGSLNEAKEESEYREVFAKLQKVIGMLGDI